MSNISISGINHDSFFDRTKSALESFQGSPIRKDSKVRQFMVDQLNQPNEHTLSSVFSEGDGDSTMPTGVYLVTTLRFDFNDQGTGMVLEADNISNKICIQQEDLQPALKDAVSSAFPDHDGVAEEVLGFSFVADHIADIAEDVGKTEDQLFEELSEFTSYEIMEWLFEQFTAVEIADHLLTDITNGMYQVKWEYLNI